MASIADDDDDHLAGSGAGSELQLLTESCGHVASLQEIQDAIAERRRLPTPDGARAIVALLLRSAQASREQAAQILRRRALIDPVVQVLGGCCADLAANMAPARELVALLEALARASPSAVRHKCSGDIPDLWASMSALDAAADGVDDLICSVACLTANLWVNDRSDAFVGAVSRSNIAFSLIAAKLHRRCHRLMVQHGAADDTNATCDGILALAPCLCSFLATRDADQPLDLRCNPDLGADVVRAMSVADLPRSVYLQLAVLLWYCGIDPDSDAIRESLSCLTDIDACCAPMLEPLCDEDAACANLFDLSELLRESAACREIAAYVPGLVRAASRCLLNIDEDVLSYASTSLYYLLLSNAHAQALFISSGDGFAALVECLHDYNVAIRMTSLEILCILAADQPQTGDDLKTFRILQYIVRLIGTYGACDDVCTAIVEAGAGVIGLALTGNRANQEYLVGEGAVQVLVACLATPSPPLSPSAIDSLLSALSIVLFRSSAAQDLFREARGFDIVVGLWSRLDLPPTALSSVLTTLGNAIDTCIANQDLVGCDVTFLGLLTDLVAATAPISNAYDDNARSMSFLLLSHVTWNHPRNQARFSYEPIVRHILRTISSENGTDTGLFALMALANLSYQNRSLQDLIASTDGIAALVVAFAPTCSSTRAPNESGVWFGALTTALGNLVKVHAENGRRLAELGGVDLLLACINDNDDDETSKQAFLTIVQMNDVSAAHILHVLAGYDLRRKDEGPVPGTAVASRPDLVPYLIALNGIVYLESGMAEFVVAHGGLAILIRLLREHPALGGYVMFVLVNLTVSHARLVQRQAIDDGVLVAIESFLQWLGSDGAAIGQEFSRNEARRVSYQVLENLLTGNTSNCTKLLSLSGLTNEVLLDCGEAVDELLPEAVQVLLTISENGASTCKAIGSDRVRRLLHRVRDQTQSRIVHAKAQQTLDQIAAMDRDDVSA